MFFGLLQSNYFTEGTLETDADQEMPMEVDDVEPAEVE